MESPQTRRSPHTSRWAHCSRSPLESVVVGVTVVFNHHDDASAFVLMAFASASAPAALIDPAPWVSTSAPGMSTAVYCRIAFTVFGVGDVPPLASRLALMMSATTPVVT